MDLLAASLAVPFDYDRGRQATSDWQLPIVAISVGYVVAVFGIQFLLRSRPAFELRITLIAWNALLAVYSALGAYKIGRGLQEEVDTYGVISTLCYNRGLFRGETGRWTFFFCYSKLLELGDTFFLVLRKKRLIFLHWYHHIATLNYAVLTYIDGTAFNVWMMFMNLCVHAVMYSYYLVSACGYRVPPVIARFITVLQIAQFAISHVILLLAGWLSLRAPDCDITAASFGYCIVMEASYIFLFGKFFYESYVKNGGRKFAAASKQKGL